MIGFMEKNKDDDDDDDDDVVLTSVLGISEWPPSQRDCFVPW